MTASSLRYPLGSILENVRDGVHCSDTGDGRGPKRGTQHQKDFYFRPTPTNRNPQLLAVNYPHPNDEEKKNKKIKVSEFRLGCPY